MNTDDFEKMLERQPLHAVPPEWRGQILSAATRQSDHVSRFSRWRELFWPSPYAWASLAATWLVVLFLNLAASDSPGTRVAGARAAKPVPSSAETLFALEQHLRLRAELTGLAEPAESPKPDGTRPRSARRTETVAV